MEGGAYIEIIEIFKEDENLTVTPTASKAMFSNTE